MSFFNQLLVSVLPLVPKPIVRWVSTSYVAGDSMDDMVFMVQQLNQKSCHCTVDLLGEFTTSLDQARSMALFYESILQRLQEEKLNAGISIKLTALGLLIDKDTCYELLKHVVQKAALQQRFVRIDMEDSPCVDDTLDLYRRLRSEGLTNVGCVLQAYLRRTLGDVRELIDVGAKNFRLCKGIYVEPRHIAYRDPDIVNKNYVLLLEEMIRGRAYVGIATHDEKLVWEALRLIDRYQLSPDQYEFQMLLGVDEPLRQILLDAGHPVTVYVPFGQDWYGYCLRRLKENPKIAGYVFKNFVKSFFRK